MKKILYTFIAFVLLAVFPSTLLAEEILFYHTDNFGTPMAMTDMSGKVVWRSDELPFGEEYQTEEIPARNDRRFLGKQLDEETGLVSMGARYLDPRTGRFTQPDPVGLVDPATGKVNREMLLNPQRLNRYVYGLNNPYKYVDPEGMSAKHRPGREYQDILEGGGFRLGGGPSGSFLKSSGRVNRGLGGNPFKGKSFKEIDRILSDRGFKKIGRDPASGKGSYFHNKTGRKYYLDRGKGGYKKGMIENPHVDVHRMRNGKNIETEKRKYPLGDKLYEHQR